MKGNAMGGEGTAVAARPSTAYWLHHSSAVRRKAGRPKSVVSTPGDTVYGLLMQGGDF